MLIDKDLRLDISDCFWLLYASKYISKKYRKQLTEMRNEMIRHLSERGEEFVKDGRLVVKEKTMLYGPNYPGKENKR